MPGASFHSNFWAGSADIPVPPAVTTVLGYPAWQTTITIGGGFGVTQVVWEWLVARVERRLTDGNQ